MKSMRLTKEERAIEKALLGGKYKDASREEFDRVAGMVAQFKKDSVLNVRVNGNALDNFKKKARARGIPYQTMVAELIRIYSA